MHLTLRFSDCKTIWILPFASDLCPGETCYPFPGAVQVTIWPQKHNSKHSPVFQPKTNLLSFPTWQLNKYFILPISKGELQQRGFVHCSYKHQPCLQIKPEQVAQSEHIYSTNVTPFCSESTTSSLQLLIYLVFAIVQQAILATDCSLDLPDIFLTCVSNFYFVDAATFLLENREPEGQDSLASLSEWPYCSDCSQSLLDPTLSWTVSFSNLICLKHSQKWQGSLCNWGKCNFSFEQIFKEIRHLPSSEAQMHDFVNSTVTGQALSNFTIRVMDLTFNVISIWINWSPQVHLPMCSLHHS